MTCPQSAVSRLTVESYAIIPCGVYDAACKIPPTVLLGRCPLPTEERPMCSPTVCNRCGKITWTGCGQHVDQALANVPPENRCICR